MIFKKYKIGKVGSLLIRFKRVIPRNNNDIGSICKYCGISDKCENLRLYKDDIKILYNTTYKSICKGANIDISDRGLYYIPWNVLR